jgi:hypothetical protein
MTEAVRTSETAVNFYQTPRRNFPTQTQFQEAGEKGLRRSSICGALDHGDLTEQDKITGACRLAPCDVTYRTDLYRVRT